MDQCINRAGRVNTGSTRECLDRLVINTVKCLESAEVRRVKETKRFSENWWIHIFDNHGDEAVLYHAIDMDLSSEGEEEGDLYCVAS